MSAQRCALPTGVTSGWITLADGTRVWVEYLPNLIGAVRNLPDLKEAIEDVVVRAAHSESCDWVRIRSLFHPTTIRDDGSRVMDRWAHHTVVEMRSTIGGKIEKAHIYVDGFEQLKTLPTPRTPYILPSNLYDQVKLKRVRWQSQRTGSSVGSNGGNTPATLRSSIDENSSLIPTDMIRTPPP